MSNGIFNFVVVFSLRPTSALFLCSFRLFSSMLFCSFSLSPTLIFLSFFLSFFFLYSFFLFFSSSFLSFLFFLYCFCFSNVIRLYAVHTQTAPLMILMELANSGNALEYLLAERQSREDRNAGGLTDKDLFDMILQTADGMTYLHAMS